MIVDVLIYKWMKIYINRLVERGLTLGEAQDNYEAAGCPHDLDDDPIQAADDELSYMASDGQ